jgi:hypothetical protein
MLFFRADGKDDDARIDFQQLKVAFANSPSVYAYPLPASIDEELSIPEGKVRLNVLAFSGLSPVKEEKAIRIPISGYHWIKIALPRMVSRPSRVARVEVACGNGEVFDLALLEDMSAVAVETFKNKRNLIYAKSVIRATVKGLTSSALDAAKDQTDDAKTSLILGIFSFGAQIFAEASEQADLRLSRYFPGRAYVGGINLEPGIYSIRVNYYTVQGDLIESFERNDMPVQVDRLTLVESICVK